MTAQVRGGEAVGRRTLEASPPLWILDPPSSRWDILYQFLHLSGPQPPVSRAGCQQPPAREGVGRMRGSSLGSTPGSAWLR